MGLVVLSMRRATFECGMAFSGVLRLASGYERDTMGASVARI